MNIEIKERIEMINRGEIPEGYKKTKVGIIPKDWEVEKFESYFKINQGLQIPISKRYKTKGKDRFFYITNEFLKNHKKGNNLEYYIQTLNENVICYEDDILMTRTGNTGIVLTNVKGVFHNNFFKIKYDKNELDKDYIVYYLNGLYVQKMIKMYAGISTIPDLNHSDFYRIFFIKPTKTEQQKIAKILSTWDKAIELKEKLIEQKEQQKKGLMQNLLTGKVRLSGFDGEWEEVKLGDIGETFNGLTGKTSKDFGKGKPYITYKNIFANSKIDIRDVEYVKIMEDENQNTVKYGDVFFTTSSETPDEVGMSSVLLDTVEELYLNSFCFGFRLNNFETLVPKYARFCFRGDVFRNDIFKLAQGSTRFNLSKAEVLKLYIKLPSIDEQKAIAQIFSTADKEINLLTQELELLKLQKKGLMQLLLTGIVRVATDNLNGY